MAKMRIARPRLAVVMCVAGLHLLVVLGLMSLRGVLDRGTAAREVQSFFVTLLQAPVAMEQRAEALTSPSRPSPVSLRQPEADRGAPSTPVVPPQSVSVVPSAATEPAPVTLPLAARAYPTPVPAPDSAASAPLNLTLPRGTSAPWRQRHPARDDPRANSAPRTLEGRLGEAMAGPDRPAQERLSDGSVRLRRGTECVVAHPNRAENLDPFNANVLPKPRLVEGC